MTSSISFSSLVSGVVGLDDRSAHAHLAVEVDADHDVGAEGAGGGDRDRVDEGAVHEPAPADHHRVEDAGKSVGGPHGLDEGAARQPDLVAAHQLGGDGAELDRQRLDPAVRQILIEQALQPPAGDQARAAEMEVEEAHDAPLGQGQGEGLQLVELARRIAAADDGADGAARNHVGDDAGLLENSDDTDMRPAPCGAAAQSQADPCFRPEGRARLAPWSPSLRLRPPTRRCAGQSRPTTLAQLQGIALHSCRSPVKPA